MTSAWYRVQVLIRVFIPSSGVWICRRLNLLVPVYLQLLIDMVCRGHRLLFGTDFLSIFPGTLSQKENHTHFFSWLQNQLFVQSAAMVVSKLAAAA